MRILTIMLIAAVVGTAVGGTLAYVEVRDDRDTLESLALDPAADRALTLEPRGRAPRIEVVEPHYNFGKMERGHEKSHEFLIRNIGDAPLKIRVGQTSCKCTLSEINNDAIAPGESTHVKLAWSAKSDRGPFRQTATIHTNDPRQPDVELQIDGEIVDASGIEPPDFSFDKLAVGESKSAQVHVMAMLQDELTINGAELEGDENRDKFDIKVEPLEPDQLPDESAKDGARVTVTVKPGLPIGRFYHYVVLDTNLHNGQKLHIPIIGRVVGDISLHGTNWREDEGVLLLGRVESAKGKTARLNIVVRGDDAENVRIGVGSLDPPELKVSVGEPKRLRANLLHVPLDVEVPAGTRPMARMDTGQGEGKVVLTTTHPEMKELSFGVRFAVER